MSKVEITVCDFCGKPSSGAEFIVSNADDTNHVCVDCARKVIELYEQRRSEGVQEGDAAPEPAEDANGTAEDASAPSDAEFVEAEVID